VDITWLGHAAIRMRARDAAVVMDPTDKSAGNDMGRPDGSIITISHDHPHHNHVKGVKGEAMVLDGAGEYEISGVQIQAFRSQLRPVEGVEPVERRGTVFIFEAEEMRLAHLGGLGVVPPSALAEELTGLDILFMPIGCEDGLPADQAARVTRSLEPTIVIPVAYEPGPDGKAPELEAFVERLGGTAEEPVSRFTVNRRTLGDGLRIVLLESRG